MKLTRLSVCPAVKHPVPSSLHPQPLGPPVWCHRGCGHSTTNTSSPSYYPLRYLPFIFLSFNPHRSPAHSQPSACPTSADQSQEAARESFKQAVCFSAGWKIPQRKNPFMFRFTKPVRIPSHHIDSCWLADWTVLKSPWLKWNVCDSKCWSWSCSLPVKLHHFLWNIIPTCVPVLFRLLLSFFPLLLHTAHNLVTFSC